MWGKYDPYSRSWSGQSGSNPGTLLGDHCLLELVLTDFITHGLVSSIKFKIGIVMVLSSTVFQTQRTMLMTATNKFNSSSEFVTSPLNCRIMVGVRIWRNGLQVSALNRIHLAGSSRGDTVLLARSGLGNCGSGSSR